MYDICIIGSGQSGLVTCKTFAEKKYNVIILEKNNKENCLFYSIKEKDYFKWSTSRSMSGFSDFPMDKNLPHWFTMQQYIDYLESYKNYFNLEKYINYNSQVIDCKQDNKNNWIVKYKYNGIDKELICKKLIVCSGLNQTPKYPVIVSDFKREIIHTDYVYRNMSKEDWKNKFSNKNILILGGGESAFDIGHIVVQHAKNTYFTTKDYIEWFPKGHEDKEIINSDKIKDKCEIPMIYLDVPTDTKLLYCEYSLPEPMSEIWHRLGRTFIHKINNYNCGKCNHQHEELCTKTETPDDLFLKQVVKRTEFMIDIRNEKVKILYYPDKIENNIIYTKDKNIDDIDIIICSTGYKKHIPFLNDNITNDEFIKKIIPKNTSNIAFIGFARPTMGSIAMVAEMQSWWVESFFNNNLSYSIRKPLFRQKDVLNLYNNNIDSVVIGCYYLKDLAKDMNIEPNMLYLLFTDFELFLKIYFGSCHPMIYRISGYKTHNDARNILMNTFVHFDDSNNYTKWYIFMFIILHVMFILFLFMVAKLFLGTKYQNFLYPFLILLLLFFYR